MFNPEKISTNESSEDSTERNLGKLALQDDLAKAGNELAQRKHERFQNQRIQEQIYSKTRLFGWRRRRRPERMRITIQNVLI